MESAIMKKKEEIRAILVPHMVTLTDSATGRAVAGISTAAFYDLIGIPYGRNFTPEENELFSIESEACMKVFGISFLY